MKETENPIIPANDNKDIESSTKMGDVSKKIDKEKIKFIQETLLYSGDDPFPEKLVERPEKGVVWGLGGELLKYKESE
jgi:hypothetical protein